MDNELSLIKKVGEGDKEAFGALYGIYCKKIYALELRLTGNPERAEEACQETFIKVWEKIGQFKGDSSFYTWITRVAINCAFSQGRKRLKRKKAITAFVEAFVKCYDKMDGRKEELIDLEISIQKLPDRSRTALILHSICGYKHYEVAEIMGISEGASKAHIFRAKRLLKKELGYDA